ncbi:putative wsc domain protein [Erysiphe neolycopersici]|uniref:Putative wsc domain protein n=1 Tax=Erysiphe neolycopersici TaxID=212602 RepID=A0A420HH18_9PEZI|nr:putative wsc domain protein [Erysiphe neolycopersici]
MFFSLSMFLALSASAYSSTRQSFSVNRFNGKSNLVTARMDPIVSPGSPSTHMHIVQGGNGFAISMTDNQALESTCTSSLVKNDKSNYWTPALYFQDPRTNEVEAVELLYMQVYYFFDATTDTIKAFPPGLRMVVGNPDLRTPPDTGGRINTNLANGPPQPVQWTCPRSDDSLPLYPPDSDGKSGVGIQDPDNRIAGVGFPDKNCDSLAAPLRADIHFPSCYNPSKRLNDYKNNMQFPTNGNCPQGWIHVPHMFYEVYWNTPKFADRWTPGEGKQPFILSNGDPTGYSLHGDFIAGWDVETLQHVIDTCDSGIDGMDKCPGLIGGLENLSSTCTVENPFPNDVKSGAIPSLPGDNPISKWGSNKNGVHNVIENTKTFPPYKQVISRIASACRSISDSTTDSSLIENWTRLGCDTDENRDPIGVPSIVSGNTKIHNVTNV